METARVDVVYRPLRIGFALISDDHASFRKAVKLCNAFWGGSYNPILPVDRPEAAALVELFLPDFLVPFGDDPAISAFVARFPHLKNPLFSEELFVPASHGRDGEANLLDIQNLIVRLRDTPDWKRFLDDGVRVPRWAPNDPLADAFLAQFGDYPEPEEIGIDYGQIVSEVTGALNIDIPLVLLRHKFVDFSGHCPGAAWTSLKAATECDGQVPSDGCDRIWRVSFGSDRGIRGVDNLRER